MRHGEISGYSAGCRCDACREAMRAYQARRRLVARREHLITKLAKVEAELGMAGAVWGAPVVADASPDEEGTSERQAHTDEVMLGFIRRAGRRLAPRAQPATTTTSQTPPPAQAAPVVLAANLPGQWSCGHVVTLGPYEVETAKRRGLRNVPCPQCRTAGLAGVVDAEAVLHPVLV